jgi:N-acetylneuraminic acid mutarotase
MPSRGDALTAELKPKSPPPAALSSAASASPIVNPPGNLVTWRAVAELSTPRSGHFAGPLGSSGRFVVAGGTHFPDKGPLAGGMKRWSQAIDILTVAPVVGKAEPNYEWIPTTTTLPQPRAGGVSIPLPQGLLCVGGCGPENASDEVTLLSWDEIGKKVVLAAWPPLPHPRAWLSGGVIGDWIIVLGGSDSAQGSVTQTEVWGLDLGDSPHRAAAPPLEKNLPPTLDTPSSAAGDLTSTPPSEEPLAATPFSPVPVSAVPTVAQVVTTVPALEMAGRRWVQFPSLPKARRFPVCVGAGSGPAAGLYVLSGRAVEESNADRPLRDGFRLSMSDKKWHPVPELPACVMGGTAVPWEPGGILVLGGDDGRLSAFLSENARPRASEEETLAYQKFNESLLATHPGYRREMLLYHPLTKVWKAVGSFPQGTPALTPAMMWDGAIVLVGGESKPGSRSATVWVGSPEVP